MKSLANAIAALLLAALWCIAGTCTPKPPAASPIAVPALIPEAAAPKPNDDGAGDLSQPQPTSTNLVAETAPPLIDLPPDAGAEPDADSTAAHSVESVFEKHFFNAGVDDSRLCHICGESIYHANHKWQDPKDIVCTNPDCTCKQCGSHCGWDCRCGHEEPASTVKQSLTPAPTACATCAPAAATYRPVYRQPVYQPVYQRSARRGLFNGRFRR